MNENVILISTDVIDHFEFSWCLYIILIQFTENIFFIVIIKIIFKHLTNYTEKKNPSPLTLQLIYIEISYQNAGIL